MYENEKEVVGRTRIPTETCKFTWSIENFSMCAYKDGKCLNSPKFTTGKSVLTTWKMRLYPNEKKTDSSEGNIDIFLERSSSDSSAHYAVCKISLLSSDSTILYSGGFEHLYDKKISIWGYLSFDRKVVLEEARSLVLPQDTLTILCELKTSRVDDEVFMESSEDYRTIDCTPIFKKPDSLMSDFQHLYDSKIYSDFTLKVGGKEFKVHKNILCIRSSVFRSMMSCGMKESLTNCVEITDFDPSVINAMVRYIYSGQVNDLTPDMSMQLYSAADKYNLPDLKDMCSKYLSRNLCVDNICSAFDLGELYNEPELKNATRNFISMHAAAIQKNKNWNEISKSRPDLALAILQTMLPQRKKKSYLPDFPHYLPSPLESPPNIRTRRNQEC